MTEADAITDLRNLTHATGEVAAPNVNALGHETDYLLVTRAGLVYEYEVKLTASDFKADLSGKVGSAKWARQAVMQARAEGRAIAGWSVAADYTYAELDAEGLSSADQRWRRTYEGHWPVRAPTCPNRFYYAYPDELHEQLSPLAPPWAGIVLFGKYPKVARKAKRLHADPLPHVRDRLLVSTNHRYWRVLHDHKQARRELARLYEKADAA